MLNLAQLAQRLQKSQEQLRLPIELLRQGYNPTFLSVYRADEVGRLNRMQLEGLQRAIHFDTVLTSHKQETAEALKADGAWNEVLGKSIDQADSVAMVDVLSRASKSKRGSRQLAEKMPLAANAAEAILTFEGQPPADVDQWLFEKFAVDANEQPNFLSTTQRILQVLVSEDIELLQRLIDFMRRKVAVSAEMLPAPVSDTEEATPQVSPAPEVAKQPPAAKDATTHALDASTVTDEAVADQKITEQTADDSVASTTPPSVQLDEGSVANPGESISAASTESATGNETSTSETSSEANADQETGKYDDLPVEGFGKSGGKLRRTVNKKSESPKSTAKPAKLSPRKRRRRWLKSVLESLVKTSAPLSRLTPYQALMLGRGHRSLIVKLRFKYDRRAACRIITDAVVQKDHPLRKYILSVIEPYLQETLLPRLESDLFAEAEEFAQQSLLDSALERFDDLLLQRPVEGKTILSVDAVGPKMAPVAIIRPDGSVAMVGEIPCNSTRTAAVSQNISILGEWIHSHKVDLVVLSNGPARRYLIHTVKELLNQSADGSLHWTMADRSGVDAYCGGRLALQELPNYPKRHRAAIWLGRRIQDPLSQLMKVDPTRVRLGSYQRELPDDALKSSLNAAFSAAKSVLGVDYWNAQEHEFAYLPGLNSERAKQLVAIRDSESCKSRSELKEQLLHELGETDFRQAVGFLRIFGSSQTLDGTTIHPDDYKLAERLVANFGLAQPPESPDGWVRGAHAAIPEAQNGQESTAAAPDSTEENATDENASEASPNSETEPTPAPEAATADSSNLTNADEPDAAISNSESAESAPTDGSIAKSVEPPADIHAESPSEDTVSAPDATPAAVSGDNASEPVAPANATPPSETAAGETTPSSETPSSETPSSETPSSETPSSETPSIGTPSSDAREVPASETASVDSNEAQEATSDADGKRSSPNVEEAAKLDASTTKPNNANRELKALEMPKAEVSKADFDVEKNARQWQVGREKLSQIANSLQNPFLDLRKQRPSIPILNAVPTFENLRPGVTVWATVIGVAKFGVFAELGPDCSGLIHISRLSNSYLADPNEATQIGDLIQVWVQHVDLEKRKIALTAIPPGMESDERSSRRGDERGRGYRGGGNQRSANPRDAGNRQQSGGQSNTRSNQGNSNATGRGSGDVRRQDQSSGRGDRRTSGGDRSGGKGFKGRRDRGNSRSRPGRDPVSFEQRSKLAPRNEAPLSDEVQSGKAPMRSFGDLAQFFQHQRDEVEDKATEKKVESQAKASVRANESQVAPTQADSNQANEQPSENIQAKAQKTDGAEAELPTSDSHNTNGDN